MTLSEQFGIYDPKYAMATPFAKVGVIALHFVMERWPGVHQDQCVGIGLRPDGAGDRGLFVSNGELPLLADIINGIVRRGQLRER